MTAQNPVELDPDLAAALAESEAEDGPGAQAASATAPEPTRKNKGGRPRKKPMEPIDPGSSANVPGELKPKSLDIASVWERILDKLRDRGLGGSEQVTIGVTQISIGPNREEPKNLNSIPGEAVGGSRNRTPGEDLQDYLERGIHVPSGMGPCKYRLMFRLRGVPAASGDSNLGVAEVTLPSAADIRKRWEAIAQLQRDKERDNDFGPLPRAGYGRPPEPYGQAPVQQGAAPASQPMGSGGSEFYRAELDRVWGMYDRERRLAQRLGEAPPPPPDPRLYGPPPAPPSLTKTDVAQTVVETLQALGLVPKPGQQPAAPPLTQPVVERAVTAPMSAAKEFFQQMREFRQMESEMREMFAPEETEAPAAATVVVAPPEDKMALRPLNEQFARFGDAPIMYGEQVEGESLLQYLIRLAAGNPNIAGALLEKGAKMLDSSSFGKLIAAFTQMGGPQAQAARNLPPGAGAEAANGSAQQLAGWSPNIG